MTPARPRGAWPSKVSTDHVETSRRSRRGTQGTAILEFALIAPIFALFLFGIICFGLILGFKQNVTQAANEGARAGAVVLPDGNDPLDAAAAEQRARLAAYDATNQALAAFGHACDQDGMGCDFPVDHCDGSSGPKCIRADVSYDYEGHPFLPDIPLLNAFFPSTLSNSATAQINPGFSFPVSGGSGGSTTPDPDCNQLLDDGCEPLCDDTPDNGVADCLAVPSDDCNDVANDGVGDCSPTQTCDDTPGNGVPDCMQDPISGEECNNIEDDGVAVCPV